MGFWSGLFRFVLLCVLYVQHAYRFGRRLFLSKLEHVDDEKLDCDTAFMKDKEADHVGIVLPSTVTTTEYEMMKVAELTRWLSGFVSFVTVYQKQGSHLSHVVKFIERLECITKQGCVAFEVKYPSKKDSKWDVYSVGQASRVVVVHFISDCQSEGDFVNSVKLLAKDVKEGKLDAREISASSIRSKLMLQVCDPNFVYTFSGASREGYLPWHIKFTEFFDGGRLVDFRYSDFLRILKQYAKVEQRYGA